MNTENLIELPTIDNYFISTVGTWKEIDTIPEDFVLGFSSQDGSKYYYNSDNTEIIRVSNHWGSGIKMCNWYLDTAKNKENHFHWDTAENGRTAIGWISLDKLKMI